MDQEYKDFVLFPVESLVIPILSGATTLIVALECVVTKFVTQPLGAMVFGINFAQFIFSFAKSFATFVPPSSSTYCDIIHLAAHTGLLSSAIWEALFAHALLILITYHTGEAIQKVLKYYITLALTIPLSISLVSVLTNYVKYIEINKTCSYPITLSKFNYSYIFYTALPQMIACLISIVCYLLVFKKLKATLQNQNPKEFLVLLLYPGIFVVCCTPLLIVFSMMCFGEFPNTQIVPFLRGLAQLQGFFYALVYGEGSRGIVYRSCAAMRRLILRRMRRETVSKTSYTSDKAEDLRLRWLMEENSIISQSEESDFSVPSKKGTLLSVDFEYNVNNKS